VFTSVLLSINNLSLVMFLDQSSRSFHPHLSTSFQILLELAFTVYPTILVIWRTLISKKYPH